MAVCCTPIPASLIRQVWDVIEQTQSRVLLQQNDQEMIRQISCELQQQRSLNKQEIKDVVDYLNHRTSLIHDVASDRRGVVYC